MKKLIIATDVEFWIGDAGGKKRIATLCEYFIQQPLEVYLFFVGTINQQKKLLIKKTHQFSGIYTLSKSQIVQEKKNFAKILPQRIRQFFAQNNREPRLRDFYNAACQAYFQQICLDISPDYIVIERVHLSYLIDNFPQSITKKALTLIDTIDFLSERCSLFHKYGQKHWINISEKEEKKVLQKFDVIIAIQNQEAKTFQTMLPHKKVITAPYVYPLVPPATTKPLAHQISLNYIAKKNNISDYALTSFITQVWEVLYAKFAEKIILNIAGSVCDILKNKDIQGVKLLGFVDNLEDFYQQSDIIINPVRFGGGIKIKNVEALCNSKPLLTTTVGAQGLESGINKAFFAYDTPEEMIRCLSRLIEDETLRKKMSDKAYEFAQAHFTIDKAYQELYNVINSQ